LVLVRLRSLRQPERLQESSPGQRPGKRPDESTRLPVSCSLSGCRLMVWIVASLPGRCPGLDSDSLSGCTESSFRLYRIVIQAGRIVVGYEESERLQCSAR